MAELRMFIFRTEVLKLYRSFQRASRLAPPESQGAQTVQPSGLARVICPHDSAPPCLGHSFPFGIS